MGDHQGEEDPQGEGDHQEEEDLQNPLPLA